MMKVIELYLDKLGARNLEPRTVVIDMETALVTFSFEVGPWSFSAGLISGALYDFAMHPPGPGKIDRNFIKAIVEVEASVIAELRS